MADSFSKGGYVAARLAKFQRDDAKQADANITANAGNVRKLCKRNRPAGVLAELDFNEGSPTQRCVHLTTRM